MKSILKANPDWEASRSCKKPLSGFLAQTGAGTASTYLTSGVFLSGLAILMGAGDVLVSYLSVIVNICGVVILFFSAFLERFESRKGLTIVLTLLSRLATLFLVLIPAVIPKQFQMAVFVAAVVTAFTLQAQTTVVLNQWMLPFIDEKRSGQYISLCQTLTLIVTVALSMIGGRWLDYAEGTYAGFVVLFGAAAILGIVEIVLLLPIPDIKTPHSFQKPSGLLRLLKLPLKDKHFMGFVLYIFSFYLLLNIGDSFTMLYMMKYLELPYQNITAMYLIITLPQLVLLGMWGKISDRKGHGFALKTSVWLFAGETLFMFFASPQSCYIFIPLAFLVASVGNAGFVVAVFNRRYELMPEENRIVYDNFYTAFIGFGFILGPMIGGGIKGWLESMPAVTSVVSFGGIRILYIISTFGILLLQCIYFWYSKNR